MLMQPYGCLFTFPCCVDIGNWIWCADQSSPPLSNGKKNHINSLSRNENFFWLDQFPFAYFFCLDSLIYTQRDAHQDLSISISLSQLKIFIVSPCDYTFLTQVKFPFLLFSGPLALRGCKKGEVQPLFLG